MNGMRLTDNDTRLYFRSDSLDQNDELELGYRNEFLRTEIGDEGLSVIGWLYAVGYDETASKLAEQADDWRWMTDAEIEAYERCPLNHGAIATLIPMPSDFRHGLVEAEVLKGRVATMAAAPVDLATALEAMAKGTVVTFQDAAQDQPDEKRLSLDAFRDAIKFNVSTHHTPVAMSREGEAALAALVGAAKEHLRRDDSCWAFAKAGELKAACPYPDYSMPELSALEAQHIKAFELAICAAHDDLFRNIMRSTGKVMSHNVRGLSMFLTASQAAQMHLNLAVRREDKTQNLDEFLAHAAHAWELTHRMMNDTGATS